MNMIDIVGTVTVVFLTLCVFSFLYKDSVFWRFAEQTFIALSVGNAVTLATKAVLNVGLTPVLSGRNYGFIGCLILGILLYTRFSHRYAWMSRWSMAVLIGVGTGIAFRTVVDAQIVGQLIPMVVSPIVADPLSTINNIVAIIMVMATLFFFTYTRGRGELASGVRRIGRYTLMLVFGSAFGASILSRMAMLSGSMSGLWSPDRRYYTIAIAAVMLAVLASYEKLSGLLRKK